MSFNVDATNSFSASWNSDVCSQDFDGHAQGGNFCVRSAFIFMCRLMSVTNRPRPLMSGFVDTHPVWAPLTVDSIIGSLS